MAGAYENSIHQWRVIVVIVVDCECALTLDESAREHYTISVNEAGSRAHKAAGASAPVVWSPKPLLRVRILLPLPQKDANLDTKVSVFLIQKNLVPYGFSRSAGCKRPLPCSHEWVQGAFFFAFFSFPGFFDCWLGAR